MTREASDRLFFVVAAQSAHLILSSATEMHISGWLLVISVFTGYRNSHCGTNAFLSCKVHL